MKIFCMVATFLTLMIPTSKETPKAIDLSLALSFKETVTAAEKDIRAQSPKGFMDYMTKMRTGEQSEWSDEDLYWFYKCVQAEESINTHRGKYLTACCIVNRARLGWANGTLKGVIFQPRQFAVTRNGRIEAAVPDEDTIIACNEALDNPEMWVIAFGHGDIHSEWCDLVEFTEVGEYYYKAKEKKS